MTWSVDGLHESVAPVWVTLEDIKPVGILGAVMSDPGGAGDVRVTTLAGTEKLFAASKAEIVYEYEVSGVSPVSA